MSVNMNMMKAVMPPTLLVTGTLALAFAAGPVGTVARIALMIFGGTNFTLGCLLVDDRPYTAGGEIWAKVEKSYQRL